MENEVLTEKVEESKRRGIFSGLGGWVREFLRRGSIEAEIEEAEKREEETKREAELERRVNEVLAAKKAEFEPDYQDVQTFCCVIGDSNPIHRSKVYANFYGYKNVLVPGTQLASMMEQYIHGITSELRDVLDVDLKLTGVSIEFKDAVYPKNSVLWQVTDHKGNGKGIDLRIEGQVGGSLVVPAEAMLRTELDRNVRELAGPVRTERYVITERDLAAFYRSIGEEPSAEIPWSYLTSFGTTTLLEMSKGRDRVPSGINRSMEFEFYKQPSIGEIAVDVFLRRERKVKENFIYQFETVFSQKHAPLSYGKFVVLSDKELKYE